MTETDYLYIFPNEFKEELIELFEQEHSTRLADAIRGCIFKHTDIGLAYYVGVKGNVWNKHALDFRVEGEKESIRLLKYQEKALKSAIDSILSLAESGFVVRRILYKNKNTVNLPGTDYERLSNDINRSQNALQEILNVIGKLCANQLYKAQTEENAINDYFRDMLRTGNKYEIIDQSRYGVSGSGSGSAGQVDILILEKGKEIAIFEGLKVSSINKKYIGNHIEKALGHYNPSGISVFIVAYVGAKNFVKFWKKYCNYINSYEYINTSLRNETALEEQAQVNASVKVAKQIASKDQYKIPVYYLAINMNK